MKAFEKNRLLSNYCSANNIRIVEALENENYANENILDKHVPVRIRKSTLIDIVNIETYLGFPESCYMFTTNRALTRLGIQFFKHPTRFLNQEIDCLRTNGENNRKERISYITLVYIFLSSNTLKINDFDVRKVASILKSCYNRDGFIIKSEIVDAAEEMTGSYLTYNAEVSVFQFQHQTIFESIRLSYYKVDPKLVLTRIDFEMIREIVKLSNYSAINEEIRMIVPKELYGDLARRLSLIFRDQFSHMPSNFMKVLCNSDLMTQIDADFINQLGEHFMEASNYNISTIITYDGKSEEVVFCLLAALLWYSTIKDWKTQDIKVILHFLKTKLLSETRSNVNHACKRTIVAAFLYSCDKNNTNDIIKLFLQTIDELEISFDINRCIQDVVDRQNHPVASCILQHFSKKINIVEVIFETERETLQDLIDIFTASFSCSSVGGPIHDRARLIKWVFSSVNPKHFNMTEAVRTAGDKRLLDIVDWFLETFNYKLFDCKVLLKEACSKGWEIVVRRFLQEEDWQSFDLRSLLSAACQHSWHQIVKQLLQNSNLVTFDANVLLTDACKKDDFEIVKSLIVYISDKKSNFNDDIQNVFEALQSNQSWSMSDFCANFVKVLLKQIDSDKKLIQHKDLENLNTINLLLDSVSETTFNFPSAIAEAISKYVIYKENVLQLFIDSNHINQIRVSLLLLEACRKVNSKFVKWLLKNIDNESLKVTTSFNESCTYGRLQIITIMMQYADHKLLNFTSAFLNCVKEEWRQHNEQNEEVLKFLLNTFDHSLFDLNKIAIETIILGQEDVMKILLNNVDIQSFETEQVVDYACEQGLLGVIEISWKSDNKEQINLLSAVNRALKGNKLDVVNWFRKHINVGIMNVYVPLDLPIINGNSSARKLIIYLFENEFTFKIYIDKVIDHNRTDLLEWLYSNTKNITTHTNTIITDAIVKGRKDVILWIVQNVDKELIDMKSTAKHLLEFGFLEIVAWILQNVDLKQIAMNEACCNGFLDSFHWMQCNVHDLSDALLNIKTVISVAINRNNFETVKWMILNNDHKHLNIQQIMNDYGLFSKSLSIAKFLIENVNCNVLYIKQIMNRACGLGNLFIVKSILEIIDPVLLDLKTAFREAIYNDRLDLVNYLLNNVDRKVSDITKTFNEAWRCSHLEIVKYMIENLDHTLFDMKENVNRALKLRRIDILENILRTPNKKLDNTNTAINTSCGTDYYDMVKWICDSIDHSLPDINTAISAACQQGNLNMIKLLHVFDILSLTNIIMKTVVYKVYENGHFKILNWILDNVDYAIFHINIVLKEAVLEGNVEIVKYILDKVDHTLLDMKRVMFEAYETRNTDTVKCLLENVDLKRLDMKTAMNIACRFGILDIVKFLLDKVDHTCLDMDSAISKACEAGNTHIFMCMLDEVDHILLDMNSAIIKACGAGKTDTVKYLLDKVDHNLIDFKEVINEIFDEYCENEVEVEGNLCVKVIVENVDWGRLDMMKVMNIACKCESLETVTCIVDKVDHNLLDMNSVMIGACEEGNVDTLKCVLDKVDHNLIDFKDVIRKMYENCHRIYRIEQIVHIFEMIVENVDWKRLDMMTVMNIACKYESSVTVTFILDKVDHNLLDMNSAMIGACEEGNVDTLKCVLDKVDHNLIDFIDVIRHMYENCHYFRYELELRVLKVSVENVDWKRLDMTTVMNIASKYGSLDAVKRILDKVDCKRLDINCAMTKACTTGNTDIVKFLLDRVDNKLIDLNHVVSKIYEYCLNYRNYQGFRVFKVIVENVDWKLLDMKTVMNIACKCGSFDTVERILDKVDHKCLDMNIAMTETCKAGDTDIVKILLDRADYKLINFKEVISKLYEYCLIYRPEQIVHVFKVIFNKADWKLLDMKTVMNVARKLKSVGIDKCIIDKADHTLLNLNSAISDALKEGNIETVKYLIDKVDHNLIDFKDVLDEFYMYCNMCNNYGNEQILSVFKVIVENVDWKRLDMTIVMNVASKFESLDIIKWIVDEVDHKAFDMNSVINNALKACNIETVKYLLDKIDHNLIDFKDVLDEFYINWYYRNEYIVLVFKVIVENVDWKRLDMKTVMNIACKFASLESLDIVKCILDKACRSKPYRL